MCMMYPVPSKKCVFGPDFKAVIEHLLMHFKVHELYFCRPGNDCLIVYPRENVPFKVTEPLEFFYDSEQKKRGIISPGTYFIKEHSVFPSGHQLVLQKNNADNRLLPCFTWKDGPGIDWRGITAQ